MTSQRRDTVLFVAVPAPLGGSNRALAALLAAIDTRVRRVLASPAEGDFLEFVNERGIIEEHLPLPHGSRLKRIGAAFRIARWVLGHRRRVLAIHANASRGLNLSIAAGFLTGVPITVWVHDPVASPAGKRLGPLLRLFLRRVHWLAVSDTARRVVVGNGLCRTEEVAIVPNPVDPGTVLGQGRSPSERIVVGYLGAARDRKGFDLLPDIIDALTDLPLEWRLFTKRVESLYATPIWNRLDSMTAALIKVPGPDADVRRIYDQCDIVLVPSREESFSLVTAEAMLNGIPVVSSDLDPLRDLLAGDSSDQAGLLFPTGNPTLAAAAIRRLADDSDLRARMGEEGRRRASGFRSDRVTARLLESYGYTPP
ncbi:MAG TPA: glycosyltransferase family 4 protein [Acidimicrobiia bacterium]|nr:glycosyltransferase family 4 protein [Acidimicrobiia bacterium]